MSRIQKKRHIILHYLHAKIYAYVCSYIPCSSEISCRTMKLCIINTIQSWNTMKKKNVARPYLNCGLTLSTCCLLHRFTRNAEQRVSTSLPRTVDVSRTGKNWTGMWLCLPLVLLPVCWCFVLVFCLCFILILWSFISLKELSML